MSGVSVADVTARLGVTETSGPQSSHVTTTPFCVDVTCVACGPTQPPAASDAVPLVVLPTLLKQWWLALSVRARPFVGRGVCGV